MVVIILGPKRIYSVPGRSQQQLPPTTMHTMHTMHTMYFTLLHSGPFGINALGHQNSSKFMYFMAIKSAGIRQHY